MEDSKLAPDVLTVQGSKEAEALSALWNAEVLDPVSLGFIPSIWKNKPVSLANLRESYFSKKNNVNRRFEHKLWNALRITQLYPNYLPVVGVEWVSNEVIKVYKHPFAHLLGISAVDGGLFHKQGNFTRHGFVEVTEEEIKNTINQTALSDVDHRDVHIVSNKEGSFTANSTEESINTCKWVNPVGSSRVAILNVTANPPLPEN
ncbi:hypothetical protein TVAG_043610 [Trichomonas vaginalis G3]|uniref:Initiator binding domain-containing protein n=1 Tax=Trichomonas vaginalis (strain ATCC PRA-98 / G3) TaxID=412133 RepID=A2EVA1_TRIV3|nr:transcription-initiator DNA-binding domain ibd family [Trichomonas vaginalis G3]EAY03415.1 hypothetical protein TVAG_043610 [Trichomonas vaginalis G3]KAI5540193.1 transcription-initiator DNA-binding domain ibd family [Trichomonas vaginalis G3]|eukprot:XP_001315638.1 hypothetical protein [Trichomonas vaginalis G3]